MKKVVLCQISIMFASRLPSELDLNYFSREIAECSREVPINNPAPKELWGELPAEFPRVTVQDQNIEIQFTANNLLVSLKNLQPSFRNRIEEVTSKISKICSEIGEDFNLAYRAGTVLTISTDNGTLTKNVSAIIASNVLTKAEWQVSYLDKVQKDDLALNRWKRYIKNSDANQYNFVVDVNSEASNELKLRTNQVTDILKVINSEILKTYDEFKE